MNHGPLLFLGILLSLACSWYGLIFKPQFDLGRQIPNLVPQSTQLYPVGRPGEANQGLDIYRQEGCATCHTRQVRSRNLGADIVRGWGIRHTVAPDYLLDSPPMLGTIRIGPDLANVGARLPDRQWHLEHLYDPRTRVKDSTMPQYKYLFEKRKIRGEPSPEALKLSGPSAPEPGYEIVPTREAIALVEFLLSLQENVPLFEAPLPQRKQPAAADTNAPAGSTNAAAGQTTNAPAPAPNSPK